MLRLAILIVGGALIAWPMAAMIAGADAVPMFELAAVGGLLVLGTVAERRYRLPSSRQPTGPGWHQTGERYSDPITEVPVVVWAHEKSGRRRYVVDPLWEGVKED